MPGKLTETHREALKLFRERHGGVAESLKKYAADFRRERKRITEALQAAPATVPELARRTGLAADRVLWHVAGMRKYGAAREAGPDGDYVKYELLEQSRE
jgi:DprA winged helix domain